MHTPPNPCVSCRTLPGKKKSRKSAHGDVLHPQSKSTSKTALFFMGLLLAGEYRAYTTLQGCRQEQNSGRNQNGWIDLLPKRVQQAFQEKCQLNVTVEMKF